MYAVAGTPVFAQKSEEDVGCPVTLPYFLRQGFSLKLEITVLQGGCVASHLHQFLWL